jgi:AcrR family transcriptional regulator
MTRKNQQSGRERPAGRRLSRQLIVDAAVIYVDQHGSRAFTMRDFGNVLGVEAMALYRYVNGREDLLEAVVSAVLEDVTGHLDDALTSTWQGYLQTLANAIRQTALDRPGVFPLLAMRHRETPCSAHRCAASTWCGTSSERYLRSASATSRWWRPIDHSPAFCWAACCSS